MSVLLVGTWMGLVLSLILNAVLIHDMGPLLREIDRLREAERRLRIAEDRRFEHHMRELQLEDERG